MFNNKNRNTVVKRETNLIAHICLFTYRDSNPGCREPQVSRPLSLYEFIMQKLTSQRKPIK